MTTLEEFINKFEMKLKNGYIERTYSKPTTLARELLDNMRNIETPIYMSKEYEDLKAEHEKLMVEFKNLKKEKNILFRVIEEIL